MHRPGQIVPLYALAMTQSSNPPAAVRADAALKAAISSTRRVKDPIERAQTAGDILNLFAEGSRSLKEIRDDAVRELNDSGMGYGTIAAHLGITKGRVQQLLDSGLKTKKMGKVEVTASTEAARLREQGASDKVIVETVIPQLLEIRSSERFEPQDIAGMLNVPVTLVRASWNKARKSKQAARTAT